MLNELKWKSQKNKKNQRYYYEIINNLNFSHNIHPITSGTRSHQKKLISLPARLNCYYHSQHQSDYGTHYLVITAANLNNFISKLNDIDL